MVISRFRILIIIAVLIFFIFESAFSQSRTSHFNLDSKGVAIEGYDPVAYFNQGKAAKGDKQYYAEVGGVYYYFVDDSNRQTFINNPSKYEPQYGGWCAYAMGLNGDKVSVDPGTFKVLNGKLYLFYNAYFTNTLPKWEKDESNLQYKADKNWASIYK